MARRMGRPPGQSIRLIRRFLCIKCGKQVSIGISRYDSLVQVVCDECEAMMRPDGLAEIGNVHVLNQRINNGN